MIGKTPTRINFMSRQIFQSYGMSYIDLFWISMSKAQRGLKIKPENIIVLVLTCLFITCVGLVDDIIKPHVSHSHPVLCQGTSLIWTNSWCRSQGFHRLQILDQTILAGHSFGGQSQAHLKRLVHVCMSIKKERMYLHYYLDRAMASHSIRTLTKFHVSIYKWPEGYACHFCTSSDIHGSW